MNDETSLKIHNLPVSVGRYTMRKYAFVYGESSTDLAAS